MLTSISQIQGSTIDASDGSIGTVGEAYFDDQSWAVRYLVVDTGTWLSERKVLISPYVVQQPLDGDKRIGVTLTRQQVENSPHVDTHEPVSRRHEREQARYYAFPEYWGGGGLWAMGAFPVMTPVLEDPQLRQAEREALEHDVRSEDVHLRSSAAVIGYDIEASDKSIGHVKDFVFDTESWAVRYLVVDTHNWWPGGKKVLIATHWIDRIDWADKRVYVNLTREQVKASPEYVESLPIERDYETRLHDAYGRRGYWD